MNNLTANEVQTLEAIADFRNTAFSFFDEGIDEGSNTWSNVFAWEGASYLNISEKAMGGVISSLIQKDIFKSEFYEAEPWNDQPASYCLIITAKGAEILKSMRERVGA